MPENKTKPTEASVTDYVAAVDARRRDDVDTILAMMERASGEKPTMWGPSMVGFGRYTYRYESGRTGESFLVGMAARKSDLTIYVSPGFDGYEALLGRLGPHKTGKSCLYIKRLSEIDQGALEELIVSAIAAMRARYPA